MTHLNLETFRILATSRRTGNLVRIAVIFAGLAAVPSSHAAIEYQLLKSFGFSDLVGGIPSGPLIQGRDGALYGTTRFSGINALGTVFKVNPDGSDYSLLHRFYGVCADGINPSGGLLEGSDGALYGTTFGLEDGNVSCNTNTGTVFKLNKDGTGFTTLHVFSGFEGRNPAGGLIEGSDGALYGTASKGSFYNFGTVFKLNKDGSGYSILHVFDWADGEGRNPRGTLIQASDGALYGGTVNGGKNQAGIVFKLRSDGSGYEVLHAFKSESSPVFPLIEGTDGSLYGTTFRGGSTRLGTAFKLNKDGSGYAVLREFWNPNGPLLEGSDGTLYGTTAPESAGSGSVFALNKDGSGYRILHDFNYPLAPPLQFGLIQGRDGALYGTAAGNSGAAFKLNKDGSAYSILHSFSVSGGDGFWPGAPLIEESDGALYGMTPFGGSFGEGTIFKLNKDGSGYNILHSFRSDLGTGEADSRLIESRDGALYGITGNLAFKLARDGSGYKGLRYLYTLTGLTAASDMALYGTTILGGSSNAGAVFRMRTDGSDYTVLHSFRAVSSAGGWYPTAGVTEGSDGVLYGTTYYGGPTLKVEQWHRLSGWGTVFKLNKDGSGYSILHSFTNNLVDGSYPNASVIEGSDGALYGTTSYGGTNAFGTIFRLNRDGSEYSILHHFTNDSIVGSQLRGGLVEGRDGALYGTIFGNFFVFSTNVGKVFRINKDGSEYSVLHSFSTSGGDGQNPNSPLVKGSDGVLYGTTANGGDLGFGTVFRLLVNYPPVAVARISPLISLSLTDTNGFVISLNNISASVYFDASQSSDADKDPLRFSWLDAGADNPFATGAEATNVLGVGSHTIILLVSDGYDTVTNQITLEVVTAGQAVARLSAILIGAPLPVQQAHPLFVSLNAASASFDRRNPAAGLNQLQTFQSKVRAQISPVEPSLAETLIQGAQKIINAFELH